MTEWAETLTIQVAMQSCDTKEPTGDGEPERGISENRMSDLHGGLRGCFPDGITDLQEEFSGSIIAAYLRDTFPDQLSAGAECSVFFLVLGVCEADHRRKNVRADRNEEITEVI